MFEGIADTGMEMLEWIETDDDRVQALMNAYRMGVCTVAAWKLHALSEPEGLVQAWLEKNTFTGGAGWVANRMKFLKSPGRAVLIWSYWHGEPNVSSVWCGWCTTHPLLATHTVACCLSTSSTAEQLGHSLTLLHFRNFARIVQGKY